MHDLIIKGGTLVDGTGAPARQADVAVDDGRITEVGQVQGGATRTIDADGVLVTPGWVDIHTHYDGQATWDPELAPSSWHGVTTLVMGNCGVGFAPGPARPPRLAHRPDGGRRGHPRHGAGRGDRVGMGDLPRVSRRAGAAALDGRRRHPGPPRRGAGLRHGRARRQERSRPPPRTSTAMRAIVLEALRAGALGLLDLAHHRAPGHRRRGGAGHLCRGGRALRHRCGAGRGQHRRVRAGAPRLGRRACSSDAWLEVDWMRRLSAAIERPVSYRAAPGGRRARSVAQAAGRLARGVRRGRPCSSPRSRGARPGS